VSSSVLYMSMSLDGYIAGPDDKPGNPGGDGFMRPSRIELEIVRVIDTPQATHIRYRVRR
jgi:hypothetical protein